MSGTLRVRGWSDIDNYVRLMILNVIAPGPDCLKYVTVSKEWQFFIENHKFRYLRLADQGKLEVLGNRMVPRQTRYVQYLWLNIELMTYTCWQCSHMEREEELAQNTQIISEAIKNLYRILSRWQHMQHGLTLELSIQSPSEYCHWFPNWHYGGRMDIPKNICMSPDVLKVLRTPVYAKMLTRGRRDFVREELFSRVFDQPSELHFGDDLPIVTAVTGFVIRRQCRRRLPPKSMARMLKHLPRLENVTWETWRAWTKEEGALKDFDFRSLFDANVPFLKRMTIFEDFNESCFRRLVARRPRLRWLPEERMLSRLRKERLAKEFAEGCVKLRSLEHLSISYMIEAENFFKYSQPSWRWPCLQFLSLTSRVLHRTASIDAITSLLKDAAAAAKGMACLREMLIWNSEEEEACLFSYNRLDRMIGWKAMWDLELREDVLAAWSEVSVGHYYPNASVHVKKDIRQMSIPLGHAQAISQLGLPSGIVDPVSLLQMQDEARMDSHDDASTYNLDYPVGYANTFLQDM